MKKKALMLLGLSLVLAPFALAVPVNCDTVQGNRSLSRLLAGGDLAEGCFNQDKLYTNFTYSGATAATDVQFDFDFVGQFGNTEIHTALFQGPWTSVFNIGYDITVTDPTRTISGIRLDLTTPFGTGTATQFLVPGGSPNPIVATTGAPGSALHNASALSVAIAGTPDSNSIIGQVVSTYAQTIVPEPSTYAFMGLGLLAIGTLKRKIR